MLPSGLRERKKHRKKYICVIVTAFVVFESLFTAGCSMKDQGDADAEFEEYAEELFRSQAASNTVNLNYTLKEPEKYGIRCYFWEL